MPARISVIIPVYNAETLLGDCLKSVIGQTERSLEIICVNDGSTDGSACILARFAGSDRRIKVITTENSGAWAARNAGIDRASGEYIVFCDADDTVPADAYRRLADAADRGFDVVVGGCVFIDGGRIVYEGRPYSGLSDAANFQRLNVVWDRIYRRDFIRDNGLRFDPYYVGEDRVFVIKCYLAKPKWRLIKDIVYHYNFNRNDDESQSLTHRRGLRYFRENLRALTDLMTLARGGGIEDEATLLFFSGLKTVRELFQRIADGREAEEAMALLKEFHARLPWQSNPQMFKENMFIPAEEFQTQTGLQYLLRCDRASRNGTDVAEPFKNGEAGFRRLCECASAWLRYKLHGRRDSPDD